MTQRNEPWQSYRKVSTQTASPAHLVLMLYDGAISFLERGLTGFNYSDPLEFNQTSIIMSSAPRPFSTR